MRITAAAKDSTRKRILKVAQKHFAKQGFEATTTRDIAREAQIATGTLFNYFATKEAIVGCLVSDACDRASQSFAANGAPSETLPMEQTTPSSTLEEDLFAHVAANLRELKPYRKYLPVVLETSLSPLAVEPSGGEPSLRAAHLQTVAQILALHAQHEAASAVALQLYWTLYTGVLAFWSQDSSPHQEDTLALLDESLNMFVGWLTNSTSDQPKSDRARKTQNDKKGRSMPSVAQLIAALPEPAEFSEIADVAPLSPLLEAWSQRPVPVGRFRRLRMLGTLQAQIAAAYMFYWLRGWFKNADDSKRLLAETHWRTAMRLLDRMSYLRGAVMKVGQTLANFPDIAPPEFVETFERLHFDAPSMHWSLLREMVLNELGDDPEKLFAEFDKRAFAAASLGQVHAARLKTGEEVAVKIQYPGIARTIREDIRNLLLVLLPGRLGRYWENTKEQFEDLGMRLQRETDYEREAASQEKIRALFHEDDSIVVPGVYPEFSTARILTMDRLHGVHLDEFLATNPSQELRNEFARKLTRSWYRILFAGRMLNVDLHPGNFLFMDDGRLGVIDFGFMVEIDDTLWELFRKMDRPLTTGNREDRIAACKEWSWIGDGPEDADRLRLGEEYADWSWRARYCGGPFDFGDEADFRLGVDLFTEMVRKRYTLARPCTSSICRHVFGFRSLLYRLKARFDLTPIAEEEVRATGWDRGEYAPPSRSGCA